VLTRLGLLLQSDLISDEREEADFARLVSLAKAAELSGFDSLWVTDRSRPDSKPSFEAYTLLGALAVCTRTARLGALVTSITCRNPGVLAKQVTTLDILSSGRAVLGVGAGDADSEQGATAKTIEEHTNREQTNRAQTDRLEEALRILVALLATSTDSSEEVSYEGRFYQLKGAPNRPRPVQESGVPVLVACKDEKSLELVAKYADACSLSGDLSTVRLELANLDRNLSVVGRDPNTVTKTLLMSVHALEPMGQLLDRVAENVVDYHEIGIDGVIVELLDDGEGRVDGELVAALGQALS
jgi:alkanesulfonate monooxygenase SsuD/methylene tetrahydromethanopterin reductase-like flavin-dependent oxidoreductase (luciferase family)